MQQNDPRIVRCAGVGCADHWRCKRYTALDGDSTNYVMRAGVPDPGGCLSYIEDRTATHADGRLQQIAQLKEKLETTQNRLSNLIRQQVADTSDEAKEGLMDRIHARLYEMSPALTTVQMELIEEMVCEVVLEDDLTDLRARLAEERWLAEQIADSEGRM